MYLAHMNRLSYGDVVTYTGLDKKEHTLTFVKNCGMVDCIHGRGPTLQQQFIDEMGKIVHIPLGVWEFTKIQPRRNVKTFEDKEQERLLNG